MVEPTNKTNKKRYKNKSLAISFISQRSQQETKGKPLKKYMTR